MACIVRSCWDTRASKSKSSSPHRLKQETSGPQQESSSIAEHKSRKHKFTQKWSDATTHVHTRWHEHAHWSQEVKPSQQVDSVLTHWNQSLRTEMHMVLDDSSCTWTRWSADKNYSGRCASRAVLRSPPLNSFCVRELCQLGQMLLWRENETKETNISCLTCVTERMRK